MADVKGPPHPGAAHPTKQARSRETLDRLLAAAEALLAGGGLDAATVPAIAERAGLSVGVVYRRFPDKDALLRAVHERFFERAAAVNAAALDPARWEGVRAAGIVRAIVPGMVRGIVQHRALHRALYLYAIAHPDREFRRRAEALNHDTFRRLGALLLARADELGHPDPSTAVELALVAAAATLRATLIDAERDYPFATEARLAEELTALVLAYLRVAP